MLCFWHFQRIAFLACLFILVNSCNKPEYSISNLNNDKIAVIGHGGMGIEHAHQINSYPALEKCLSLNTQGIEIDVQLTSDAKLIALHGSDLQEETTCEGLVNNRFLTELQNCQYKFSVGRDYRIVELRELFSCIDEIDNYYYSLDCKLYTNNYSEEYLEAFAHSISSLVQDYDLYQQVLVETQDVSFLQKLNQTDSNLSLFYYAQNIESAIKVSEQLPIKGITISNDLISANEIKQAHERLLMVAVFDTQTKKQNKQAIDKSPDFIQTDKVKYLANLLN